LYYLCDRALIVSGPIPAGLGRVEMNKETVLQSLIRAHASIKDHVDRFVAEAEVEILRPLEAKIKKLLTKRYGVEVVDIG
jgi:hypothetical protein